MVDTAVKQLRQVPLFSKLEEDDLDAVARLAREKRFPPGATVCEQGETGDACYVVEMGALRAQRVDWEGVKREDRRLTPEGFLGEAVLLLGDPHEATLDVVRDAVLLTIDKDGFDELLEERLWISAV